MEDAMICSCRDSKSHLRPFYARTYLEDVYMITK